MPTFRERPYSQFNFLVDLGENVDLSDERAGFQEVSGLGLEINIAEYRTGNEKNNSPRKITGTYKVPDVTLKRGVIGAENLYNWLEAVRGGQQARRTVQVHLLDETTQTEDNIVQSWILENAVPIKYTGPSLNGKGTDVAIEELVLACERITQE